MACYGSNTLMSNFELGLLIRFFYGLGMGITTAPVTESIMGSLPPSRAGVGSAVNDTTRQTGGAVGVAVIGSIFLAHYHSQIGSLSFLPADVRATARESIGTSLETASRLPAALARHLEHVAHEAFLSSMRLTYTISVLIVVAAITVAYKWLPARAAPRRPPVGLDDAETAEAPTTGEVAADHQELTGSLGTSRSEPADLHPGLYPGGHGRIRPSAP
jgi:MFS family permease